MLDILLFYIKKIKATISFNEFRLKNSISVKLIISNYSLKQATEQEYILI